MSIRLICTCARGTEKALVHELVSLGVSDPNVVRGTVIIEAAEEDIGLIARVNVFSRIASRVLLELTHFEATTPEELLEVLAAYPFEQRLDEKATIAVEAHLRDVPWSHSLYASQRVKDVICDRLRSLGRERPNVDLDRPSLRYVLHWDNGRASLSLDTTDEPLHRRGYRREGGIAPLKETLGAAILAIAHADTRRPFLDPCCGTGTLAIEQAMRALKRAPGATRRFGFERWRDRPRELDRALALSRTEARDVELQVLPAPIRLSDWHEQATDTARACITAAGLDEHLKVERVDACKQRLDDDQPVVCSNLPFGERLGGENRLQLEGFYRTLGARFAGAKGARIILLSGHPQALPLLGLGKPRRWSLHCGALPATLFRWDIDDGIDRRRHPAMNDLQSKDRSGHASTEEIAQ